MSCYRSLNVGQIDELVSSSEFDIARTMLYSRNSKLRLDPQTIEDIVVTSSHELYDNASSGNYKIGDMKLAYDW